ncbi:hypothetical protein HID58_019764 [Brassica napus]|uniref:BnaA05g27830D protein n=2 Tax=Brassica napus TaxID=3708 RepID=A0A078F630_BRANA|nr:hypothetical protein HID58_019764 [Brassica napus]CAF2102159.1 unnamed protein product [Brassica napus]CDY08547.1 BnaA05g27830D [Brassica napus]
MKNAFKLLLIGFVMLTILLLGKTVVARKGKGQCVKLHQNTVACIHVVCRAFCPRHYNEGVGSCVVVKDRPTACQCKYKCFSLPN